MFGILTRGEVLTLLQTALVNPMQDALSLEREIKNIALEPMSAKRYNSSEKLKWLGARNSEVAKIFITSQKYLKKPRIDKKIVDKAKFENLIKECKRLQDNMYAHLFKIINAFNAAKSREPYKKASSIPLMGEIQEWDREYSKKVKEIMVLIVKL